MNTLLDSRPQHAPWPTPLHWASADLDRHPALDGWEEEYAYSLGLQAYVYGFPWIYLSQLRWLWTTEGGKAVAKAKGLTLPWAPLNSFWNSPELATPANTTGGSPNCDTLYSVAWLDLSRAASAVGSGGDGPLLLHADGLHGFRQLCVCRYACNRSREGELSDRRTRLERRGAG
jgi:hypothetical protein